MVSPGHPVPAHHGHHQSPAGVYGGLRYGPRAAPNNATLFYILHLYRNAFRFLHMGYASALAWALFLYILLLTLVVLRSSSVWGLLLGRDQGAAPDDNPDFRTTAHRAPAFDGSDHRPGTWKRRSSTFCCWLGP